jgi:hypothetical protein
VLIRTVTCLYVCMYPAWVKLFSTIQRVKLDEANQITLRRIRSAKWSQNLPFYEIL